MRKITNGSSILYGTAKLKVVLFMLIENGQVNKFRKENLMLDVCTG